MPDAPLVLQRMCYLPCTPAVHGLIVSESASACREGRPPASRQLCTLRNPGSGLAGRIGFEPTSFRLTGDCSTVELTSHISTSPRLPEDNPAGIQKGRCCPSTSSRGNKPACSPTFARTYINTMRTERKPSIRGNVNTTQKARQKRVVDPPVRLPTIAHHNNITIAPLKTSEKY